MQEKLLYMAKNEGTEKVFGCEWCGIAYTTRQGLAYHKKVCEYRPTDDDETQTVPGDRIDIFPDDDEGVPVPAQTAGGEDVPEYECPDCGYCAGEAYPICPRCGAGLVWN